MRLIYVAGKYRGSCMNDVYENIQKARQAARQLWLNGWAVICPQLNSAFMDGVDTDDIFLTGDLEILDRCDAIFMLKDYSLSLGALAELNFALIEQKTVYYEKDGYPVCK